MKKRRSSGTLEGAKGGDLLRALAGKTKTPAPPAPEPKPDPSLDEELMAAFSRRAAPSQRSKPVPVKKKPGSKKEILRVPAGKKHEMIAEAAKAAPASIVTPSLGTSHSDMGEAAFRRISTLRSGLKGLNASHHAPAVVPPEAREIIVRRIALGAASALEIVNRDDGHFIGYDFGTSTTKSVVRHPYRTGLAFAIPVPASWVSSGQPHLWPTAVWFDPVSERYSPLPEPGWRCLHGFKSALIEGFGHRTCCGAPVTMAEAAAAFLAFHVAYVIGAALECQPGLKIAGINIGVPVAALADTKTKAMFEKAIQMGLSLVRFATSLEKTRVHSAWGDEPAPVMPYELHAELSGAIAGYCTAPRYYLGGHMLIDCGSATLDIASFTLGNPNWPVGIYNARIEPLGADACITYQGQGVTVGDCRKAARYQEYEVFRDTLPYMRIGFEQDRGKFPYQIILIGGGIHGEVHSALLDGMEAAFHRAFHRPQLARDLEYDQGLEPGRLILADGLARAPIDLRQVAMPGDRPPLPSSPHPEMITKDQV